MRQVSYIAVQVASEVKAQKDVDKEDGDNALFHSNSAFSGVSIS